MKDKELMETIYGLVSDSEEAMDFLLFYGRYPVEGEVIRLRAQLAVKTAERSARKAIRPGLLRMLRYWL